MIHLEQFPLIADNWSIMKNWKYDAINMWNQIQAPILASSIGQALAYKHLQTCPC